MKQCVVKQIGDFLRLFFACVEWELRVCKLLLVVEGREMRLAKEGGESSWRERGEESIGEKKKVCLPPPPPSISHSGKKKKSCAEIPSLFEQKCNDAGGGKCCFFAQKNLQN